jgi:peptidoglycan biosynthesis protein MviN/MurJ (putative lipid II flippase)
VGSCPSVALTPTVGGKGAHLGGAVAQCVNQLHLSYVVTYQPASRYWPFQIYETLIFSGLAAVIGACAVWWVRRIN